MSSNTLFYYMQRVQRESGLQVSASFPTAPTDEQQLVIDCINATLRELNNHYYLAFKLTEYTLVTSPSVSSYDLRQAPYNQTFWRFNRIARNGLRRLKDDYPLMYLDYTERDYLQPSLSGKSLPTHYTIFGESIYFYPNADGSSIVVRYYGRHIGTDATGTVQKLRLSATDDLTMLDDEWEDALVYGAVVKSRAQRKVDEKFTYYNTRWEEWKQSLLDMMQPGEDGYPQVLIATNTENYLDRKIGPFFNANVGS